MDKGENKRETGHPGPTWGSDFREVQILVLVLISSLLERLDMQFSQF